jgi:predicted MPP superfamily phosphohydrolase
LGKTLAKVKHPIFIVVLLFLLTISFSFHFYFAYYFSNGFQKNTLFWASLLSFGFLSIPAAYFISHVKKLEKFYFLVWAGYIWLGFFFLLASFTVPFIFMTSFFPELQSYNHEWFIFFVFMGVYSVYWGLRKPDVVIEKLKMPLIAGLKIVQITDLHVGLLQHNEKWFDNVIEKCNQQDPDFLFLTGDLVEGSLLRVQPMLKSLQSAKAKIAKIYISGNHEMIHGGMAWEEFLKQSGWTVLHNQNQIYQVGQHRLMIAGVPDKMVNRFDKRYQSNPDLALKSDQKVDYKILLAHEPSSVFDLKNEKPDYLFSGHTHGGQIIPFGLIVRLVQPVVSGWKVIRGIPVFAHPGTGLWGPPMRLGTRNLIYVFETI